MLAALLCLLLGASCATNENKSFNRTLPDQNIAVVVNSGTPLKPKSDQSKFVSLAIEKSEIKVGGSSQAEVKLKIQSPYHVNSNPPSEKSFIPLEIALENNAGVTVGKPVYPKGELKKFAFSEDKPLSVYTGDVIVKVPLKTDKSAVAGEKTLNGKLKFQPCDEEVCYSPQTVEIALTVTVN